VRLGGMIGGGGGSLMSYYSYFVRGREYENYSGTYLRSVLYIGI